MLILSRKRNERCIVTVPPSTEPTRIEMMITEIRGDKVRIGWGAPIGVDVHREEIQRAIERDGVRRVVSQGSTEQGCSAQG